MKNIKLSLLLAAIIIACSGGLAGVARAVEGTNEEAEARTTSVQRANMEAIRERAQQDLRERLEERKTEYEQKRADNQKKLADKKLEICQKRENRITDIMKRASDRGAKQIELFSSATDRVASFYTTNNLSVANYDALVATIDEKKAAAQVVVDASQSTIVSFDCAGDDPKGVADAFRGQVQEMATALKNYRTAIKDLITAVRTVAETTTQQESTNE